MHAERERYILYNFVSIIFTFEYYFKRHIIRLRTRVH